jgi:hypothetical protein
MFEKLRRLPSPALVISAIALIVAVGGGAFAIAASDNNRDKKIARKVVHRLAPKLSVKHAASAASATNSSHAADADNATELGGVAASGYARAPAGPFHEVSDADLRVCAGSDHWQNPPGWATVAYYRDPFGVVHLKGAPTCTSAPSLGSFFFLLPPGYRPAAEELFAGPMVPAGSAAIAVLPNGSVEFGNTLSAAPAGTKVGLQSVAFRCEPSGVDGCP